jgi:hypothetical protein
MDLLMASAIRNRKFVDSLLEGNGFELPVPREKRGLAGPAHHHARSAAGGNSASASQPDDGLSIEEQVRKKWDPKKGSLPIV